MNLFHSALSLYREPGFWVCCEPSTSSRFVVPVHVPRPVDPSLRARPPAGFGTAHVGTPSLGSTSH
jgi:hypothetical protein